MRVFKAPEYITPVFGRDWVDVFLAGSIEMGKAVDWQAEVTAALADDPFVTVMNPRRDDWDSSWTQSIENEQFTEQVRWELDGLNRANIVFMYFAPETMSPITLLEFGLMVSHSGASLIVVCPPGFWRRGNLEVTCDYWSVPLYDSLEEGLSVLKSQITFVRNL